MQYQQPLEASTQTDSPRESVASKGVGCGAMHAEQTEDTGANMSNSQLEAAARAQHLERENAGLKQQLEGLESRCQQLIEAQAKELADKCRLIDALQDKLSRLSDLAAAFTDEMDGANHLIASTGMPPYQPLATMQAQLQTAPEQKPAVPTPEQLLNLPTACHLLHHLHEQMQQQQHHSSRQQNATAAAGAMCLPSAGSKRARVSSATGSGGEAIKHAFAASGGSSSSHQQLSAHEALDEDMDDDAAAEYQDEEATARCFSVKRSRSPNNYEQMPGEAAAAAAGHMAEEEDLDAAQCLQELAQGPNVTTAKPSAQETLPGKDIEERFAGEPNRVAGSNLVRYGSAGHTNATLPGAAAGAATGRAGSSSSIGGGGNSSMFGQWTPEQAIAFMAAQLKADGFAGFHNPHVQQQGAQPAQPRVSMPFGSAQQPQAAQPQQQRQQHFDGLTAQRSGSLGRPWGAAAKSPAAAAPSGPSGAPVRPPYRKQSWFAAEINDKIPAHVRQACIHEWNMRKSMSVVCADLSGTFTQRSDGEFNIRLAHTGEDVSPNKFEELAGKKTARNWQQSIRLVGFTMNGEPNSALLKLGHFTRIVGLVDR